MGDSKSNYSDKYRFRPTTTPRYLIGGIDNTIMNRDLKNYNHHRYQVFSAKAKVDTKAPKYHPMFYMKKKNIVNDSLRLQWIFIDNKNLVTRINSINCNGGCVDTWNHNVYVHTSNWHLKEYELKKIKFENKLIYNRLASTKSKYSKEEFDKFYQTMKNKLNFHQRYPHYKILTKDDELRNQPSITALTIKKIPDRTRVFMDFEIEECHQNLGRIIIELYNEYVPETCFNFLCLCKGMELTDNFLSYVNSSVHKIVKDKYMECGNIIFNNCKGGQLVFKSPLLPENFDLKHTKGGVVSMIPLKGEINSQFCITFDEMPWLDEKYTVIGKVVRGAKNLFKINDCGKRFGKPSLKLIVSKCGIVE